MDNGYSSDNISDGTYNVAVVGAGLVGSLAAIHLAKKGYEVDLYEYREDCRKSDLVQGRSINLALSTRGRKALAQVGLEQEVIDYAIPMRGRMLHDLKGNMKPVLYDPVDNQCLYSVGRKHLNELLLASAEKYANISMHFNHKLVDAKLETGSLTFKNTAEETEVKKSTNLVIGCDGAFSAVRTQMVKRPGFNFSQEYIEHGYLELCIPAKDGEFAMPPNYLHIWPRNSFMMIALPNQDKSFTVTLSMPFKIFEGLKTEEDLLNFFEEHYPDAIGYIGKEKLIEDYFKSKPQFLVSVKCFPYHLNANVLLLGDAAHAMVPYYGQGMNAGFEDCTVLSAILNQPGLEIGDALNQFSSTRWEDAHAICDLAMYNYVEMRDLCTKSGFMLRKKVDHFLHWMMPRVWVPLYNSVSFSTMPYKKCIENRKWQDDILKRAFYFGLALGVLPAGLLLHSRKLCF